MQKSVHRIFGRTRATVLGAALLSGAALPAAGLWAGTASALPNPSCVTTGITVTCTFSSTGSAISWPVPAGITHVTVVADGASGADAVSTFVTGGGSGGQGGEYKAILANIPAHTTLSVFPGKAATGMTGGANAMGAGGNSLTDTNGNTGGGGGGATTVAISPFTVVGKLLVAAGGGGGAGAENQAANTPADGGHGGGSSSPNGQDGFLQAASGRGRGGTTTTGGANGGAGSCTTSATDGSQLQGGDSNSGTCNFVGGGGGSGYFGGGGSSTGNGGGGGSAFPAALTTVGGIRVIPLADTSTHSGNGVVTISYQRVPTHLTAYIAFNIFQTFTVSGRLDSFFTPVAGQPLIFQTGHTFLCVAHTNSHGIGSCVLSYAKSVAIRQNAGRFTVIFPGSAGYLPSIALGQGIIHP